MFDSQFIDPAFIPQQTSSMLLAGAEIECQLEPIHGSNFSGRTGKSQAFSVPVFPFTVTRCIHKRVLRGFRALSSMRATGWAAEAPVIDPRDGYGLRMLFGTPPLSPQQAYRLEQQQIETHLQLPSLLSLRDHDDIRAGAHLRVLNRFRHAPIGTEWTFPSVRPSSMSVFTTYLLPPLPLSWANWPLSPLLPIQVNWTIFSRC
jgi:hypothetical protein